ncbi:MAG: hypothetical protein AAB615_00900, partial [Patescibacteria group bacterium]
YSRAYDLWNDWFVYYHSSCNAFSPAKTKALQMDTVFNMLFQWILIPVVGLLSAIPAVDSQTRILLGKYFGEFWVTEKIRKKS